MKKSIQLFAICGLLFSCSTNNETETPQPPTPTEPQTKIPINLSMTISRATDSAFDDNDKVGLYVVNVGENELSTSGNYIDNMGFTYNNNKWTPDKEIYWKDAKTAANFYVYYPYDASQSSISDYKFKIVSDQSTTEKYKSCEFLWGKKENITPTESAVSITTKHLMSNLVIYLTAGDGYTDEDLENAEIKICSVAPTAKINLADGNIVAIDAPVEITPNAESDYYRALIVPQTIENATLIKVTIDDNTYTLTTSIDFESGKQHKCTVKVSKMTNGINVGIDGWTTDDVDYGGEAI